MIYVVLTETRKLSTSQFDKITELSGGEELNERAISERCEAQEVRLAMQDPKMCEADHDVEMETFIAQTVEIAESKKPQKLRTGGVGDLVFNKVLNDYFSGSSKPSSHVALAEMKGGRMAIA